MHDLQSYHYQVVSNVEYAPLQHSYLGKICSKRARLISVENADTGCKLINSLSRNKEFIVVILCSLKEKSCHFRSFPVTIAAFACEVLGASVPLLKVNVQSGNDKPIFWNDSKESTFNVQIVIDSKYCQQKHQIYNKFCLSTCMFLLGC